MASWNSQGEGGFLDWNSEGAQVVTQFGIPNPWGDFSSEFPEGEDIGKMINIDQAGVSDHAEK